MNFTSILFFCCILLNAAWAHAYYEEILSHPQVPHVEIMSAVQEPPTTAGNIVEQPLPPAEPTSTQIGSAPASVLDATDHAVSPLAPSVSAQPQIAATSEPGIYHLGKRKPATQITSRGTKIPLSAAVLLVLPKGWRVDVKSVGKKRVSWNAKAKAWTSILGEMAVQSGTAITVNWDAGKVLCKPASRPQDSASDHIPPAVAHDGLVKKAIIAQPGTGREVARRYHLPVDDFCRWNHFGAATPLAAGYEVYLAPPPPGTIVVANIPHDAGRFSGMMPPAPVQTSSLEHLPAATAPELSTPAATSLLSYAPKASGLQEQTSASMPTLRQASTMPALAEADSSTAAGISAADPAVPLPGSTSGVSPEPVTEPLSPWEITKGQMLRGQMEGWAAVAGYSLIWNAQNDYEMKSSASFSGVFIDAVKNFFGALQANGLALRVTIYQGNKVMEVSEH